MTTVGLNRYPGTRASVDIAGTAWPVYKLEALVAGLLVFLTALVVTQDIQPAVLVAAGTAVVTWWVRRGRWAAPSAAQAARSE